MKRLLLPIASLALAALAIWHPAPRPAGFATVSTSSGAAARPAATGTTPDSAITPKHHSKHHRKKRATRKTHHRHLHKRVNPIDLNSASADALAAVPGFGPAIAERIVAFRELNGPFAMLDELLDVSGVTPGHLDRAAAYLRIR